MRLSRVSRNENIFFSKNGEMDVMRKRGKNDKLGQKKHEKWACEKVKTVNTKFLNFAVYLIEKLTNLLEYIIFVTN